MSPRLYLVGGAVRDTVLRRPVKDRDYVLVGADDAYVRARWPGARLVGESFGVYLVDDVLGDGVRGEVALARRERKVGAGYRGFAVDVEASISIEDDLCRRDLTVNAMAVDAATETLLDPFAGATDLRNRLLRHVSDAFAEDPLRVYRLARFAAELGDVEKPFTVADETIQLCRSIPKHEIAGLARDRVRVEMLRALSSSQPWRFFEVLHTIDHLDVHFEEVAALSSVPAGPPQHHGEGDAFVHTMMVLREATKLSDSLYVRFAALCHDLGKALTPTELLPKHHGHEDAGVVPAEVLCHRLGLGKDYSRAAVLACTEHLSVHRFAERRHVSMVDVVVAADRTALKAEGLADVAEADGLGRVPSRCSGGPALLRDVAKVVRSCEVGEIPESLVGPNIGLHIRAVRAAAVREHLRCKEKEHA